MTSNRSSAFFRSLISFFSLSLSLRVFFRASPFFVFFLFFFFLVEAIPRNSLPSLRRFRSRQFYDDGILAIGGGINLEMSKRIYVFVIVLRGRISNRVIGFLVKVRLYV